MPSRRPSPQPIWPGLILTLGLLLLIAAAGAVGWMYFGPGFAQASPEESSEQTSATDTGIAACQAIIDDKNSENVLLPEEVVAGLKNSADANLRAAAQTFEWFAGLNEEEQLEALDEMAVTVEQVALGCAAVGVPLPPDMLPSG